MNEGDSAGGHQGYNLALPAGTDHNKSSTSREDHHSPFGPVVSSPMSRSPTDEKQHHFQQLQQMQSTGGAINKALSQQRHQYQQQQQLTDTNSISLAQSCAAPGTGGIVSYSIQQHILSTTNTGGSPSTVGVGNVNNEANNSGVVLCTSSASSALPASGLRTYNTQIETNSCSDIVIAKTQQNLGTVVAAVNVIGCSSGSNTSVSASNVASTYIHSSEAESVESASGEPVTVSPTTSRKRIKIEQISLSIDIDHDISALKKLILEHKYMKLRNIKDKYSEHVAELFFLQSGGNMMDYPVWRKKPPTPTFCNFLRTYKLEPLSSNLEEAGEILKQQSSRSLALASSSPATAAASSSSIGGVGGGGSTSVSASGLPQGAEIKIPSVGATPVAVSTQLPAAVAQLSQQGGTPIIPDPIGVDGSSGGGASIVANPAIERKRNLSGCGSVLGGGLAASAGTSGGSALTAAVSSLSSCSSGGISTSGGSSAAFLGALGGNGSNSSLAGQNGSGSSTTVSVAAAAAAAAAVGGSGNGGGSGNNYGNGQEQYTNKAKQEVYVMQRIQELQKEGLWSEKRLPKQQEPQRPKAHWDYLLEEMVWLAADFAQERKWKKAAAKKCARMVQKHFLDKAQAAQRAEKAQELQLKRIAAFIAKEIKIFWGNVEKLVEFKQQTKLDEKRKKALDQQLSFIVDQTEKYSQQLVEGMNRTPAAVSTTGTAAAGSKANSLTSSRISSPQPPKSKSGGVASDDDEFKPSENSDDDEETIAKAEAEEATGTNEEVAALQKESEMDLDDFLKSLPKDYLENRDKIVLSDSEKSAREDASDKDFTADEDSTDDEDTIMEQEKQEKNEDHKKEIAELNAENEMSIEELMEKYHRPPPKGVEEMEVESEVSDEQNQSEYEAGSESDSSEPEEGDEEDESAFTSSDEEMGLIELDKLKREEDEGLGLKNLLDDELQPDGGKSQNNKDEMLNDAAAIAESIQPKGNTLSSTSVVTPIPFLLKHTLREYQHIGLDWLVTMHDRKLNGILADEMGLGKTIQTISLLAHLACVKGNWGPHLIIVPSSVMLNWEMEFKKWCPGFKILTYYGSQKERKLKRTGWTKVNAFHVCITSYKLVIQDHQSFRRKKWKYLILDEAQNIKNFKSQRWQLLLNFQTEQRLLLTGTPLQNNLMELWSLMHFLMPHVFQSHREFKEWFSNPMTGMIEGNSEYNDTIIKRLHKVLRPFLLRRLKSEVEKQMPKKYEHIVMCRLSKRQRFLYDDFMGRAKTRETLASGNLLSVINVLMQLRKVCNHPNMFEERPTISPFRMDGITIPTASLVYNLFNYDPFTQIDLSSLNLLLINLELLLPAYVAYRSQRLCMPKRLIEEIDSLPEAPPRCPTGKLRLHVRVPPSNNVSGLLASSSSATGVRVGTSPAMKTEGTRYVPLVNSSLSKLDRKPLIEEISSTPLDDTAATMSSNVNLRKRCDMISGNSISNNNNSDSGSSSSSSTLNIRGATFSSPSGQRYLPASRGIGTAAGYMLNASLTQSSSGTRFSTQQQHRPQQQSTSQMENPISSTLAASIVQQLATAHHSYSASAGENAELEQRKARTEFYLAAVEESRRERRGQILELLGRLNQKRCEAAPIYGEDLREAVMTACSEDFIDEGCDVPVTALGSYHCRVASELALSRATLATSTSSFLASAIRTFEQRTQEFRAIFNNFVLYVPAVCAPAPRLHVSHPHPSRLNEELSRNRTLEAELKPTLAILHPIISAMSTQFPDPRLIQYDCGKLQTLDRLLKRLKSESHRVLIFTQMTRMLDVLEAFLNYHGHIYLRLDGTTKVEQRQLLMERFNEDKRIFAFILSTRSGGVGINLTGADTVVFYDSDWNPTMDAQAQDRCHRIGQTRDVHIYRLVSEKTIEENILKKANQKRMLGDLAIEGGNFTTAYFKSSTIQDLFAVDTAEDDASARLSEVIEKDRERKERLQQQQQQQQTETSAIVASSSTNNSNVGADTAAAQALDESRSAINVFESALAAAEDDQDVQAAKFAKAEASAELDEFDESIPIDQEPKEKEPELSKAEKEVQNLIKQLNPIERYAMRFVEETEGTWTAVQLRAVEEEIEQAKREWEANRAKREQEEAEAARRLAEAEEADMLTFSREDATNQVNRSTYVKASMVSSHKNALNNSNNRKRRHSVHSNNLNRSGRQVFRRAIGSTSLGKRSSSGGSGRVSDSTIERANNNGGKKISPPLRGRAITREATISPVGAATERKGKRSLRGGNAAVASATNDDFQTNRKKLSIGSRITRERLRYGSCSPIGSKDTNSSGTVVTQVTSGARNEGSPSRKKARLRSRSQVLRTRQRIVAKAKTISSTKMAPESENSEAGSVRNAAEEFDSECSLDVMIDSNDAPNDSDSNQMNNYYHSAVAPGSGGGAAEEFNTEVNMQQQQPNSGNQNQHNAKSASKRLDNGGADSDEPLSTPRTRSRGTVKINLWTLDDSPILPVVKRNRSGGTSERKSLPTGGSSEQLSPNIASPSLLPPPSPQPQEVTLAVAEREDSASSEVVMVENLQEKSGEISKTKDVPNNDDLPQHLPQSNDATSLESDSRNDSENGKMNGPPQSAEVQISRVGGVVASAEAFKQLKVVVTDVKAIAKVQPNPLQQQQQQQQHPQPQHKKFLLMDGFATPEVSSQRTPSPKSGGGRKFPKKGMGGSGAGNNRTLDGWISKTPRSSLTGAATTKESLAAAIERTGTGSMTAAAASLPNAASSHSVVIVEKLATTMKPGTPPPSQATTTHHNNRTTRASASATSSSSNVRAVSSGHGGSVENGEA